MLEGIHIIQFFSFGSKITLLAFLLDLKALGFKYDTLDCIKFSYICNIEQKLLHVVFYPDTFQGIIPLGTFPSSPCFCVALSLL